MHLFLALVNPETTVADMSVNVGKSGWDRRLSGVFEELSRPSAERVLSDRFWTEPESRGPSRAAEVISLRAHAAPRP